jgi:hypothetical protein
MVTARLVLPGAMSPVSTLPSFRTTRCATVSLFLNTTCWPANAAGFGLNACVPFWLAMMIVGAPVDEGVDEGVDGLDDPQPQTAESTAIDAAAVNKRNCMSPLCGLKESYWSPQQNPDQRCSHAKSPFTSPSLFSARKQFRDCVRRAPAPSHGDTLFDGAQGAPEVSASKRDLRPSVAKQ